MNKYQEEFERFEKIASCDYSSYDEACQAVKSALIHKSDFSGEEAIVVLGYSGNGKTTWINNFRRDNPGYEVISYDDIVKNLTLSLGDKVDSKSYVSAIGEEIDRLCSNHLNIIFDGKFLNIFTRSALTQTLHSYGYFVSMVDLTDIIDDVLPKRLIEYYERELGIKFDYHNPDKCFNDPRFRKKYDEIMEYFNLEKKSCLFDLQKELECVFIDADFVMNMDGNTDNDFDSKGAKK